MHTRQNKKTILFWNDFGTRILLCWDIVRTWILDVNNDMITWREIFFYAFVYYLLRKRCEYFKETMWKSIIYYSRADRGSPPPKKKKIGGVSRAWLKLEKKKRLPIETTINLKQWYIILKKSTSWCPDMMWKKCHKKIHFRKSKAQINIETDWKLNWIL